MTEPNNNPVICRNGHQQTNPDSRFCIYCGTPLDVQPPVSDFVPPHVTTATPPFQQPQNGQFQPNGANPAPPPSNFIQPQQNQAIAPNYYAPQNQVIGAPVIQAIQCYTCGGDGTRLSPEKVICAECSWLRPLAPGYRVDQSAFQWAEDGKAMSALRAVKPLTAAAQTVSNKVGRRWIEATFNGVLLSERQLPEVYAQAVQAARILGMSHMPDVYVSGDHMWDCYTYGTDKDSFIVMGTALATNFKGPELLFLFAREMGHCRAGHSLWKTVLRFLVGEQQHKGLMSNGLFSAFSLTALVEGALEVPLLAWARQSEITADRAGLLAVGDEETARRVLLTWCLKSIFLYRQINIEAWLEQQSASDDGFTKISELATSSTPYITRRLKLMEDFARSHDLQRWQSVIRSYSPPPAPVNPTQPPPASASAAKPQTQPSNPLPPVQPAKATDEIKMKCAFCNATMRVPSKVLEGKEQLAIKCPNAECAKVTRLKKKINPAAATAAAVPEKTNSANIPNK